MLTSCEGHVLLDLRQRLRSRVIALQMPAVPIDYPIERIGEREAGSPMQVAARLGAVESQHFRLLQLGAFVGHPANAATPTRGELIRNPFHRLCVLQVGPEVPGSRSAFHTAQKVLAEHEISEQWIQHMLPGTHRRWISKSKRLAGRKRAHRVGDETLGRPVASTYHVPCAHARYKGLPLG